MPNVLCVLFTRSSDSVLKVNKIMQIKLKSKHENNSNINKEISKLLFQVTIALVNTILVLL